MNNLLLSVCIPTYNRAEFLPVCLESIVSQFGDSEVFKQVEVVIADNCSTDSTGSIVAKFQSQFSNIRYFKNEENLGYDKSALRLVAAASGEYVWLLGDDDALFEYSLSHLLTYLKQNKYSYILANAWGHDRQLLKPAVSRPNLKIKNDVSYFKLSDFVKSIKSYVDLVGYFSGLSCQIFKREVWLSLSGKEKYIGTQAIHFHIILLAFKELPTCLIAKPLVKTRADNIRWDSFPGLETVSKRAFATRDGQKWVLDLYDLPYSNFKLNFVCYWGLFYAYVYNFSRRTFLKNQKLRNIIKKILGK